MKEEETLISKLNGNRSVLIYIAFRDSVASPEEALSIFLYLEVLKQHGFLSLVRVRNDYDKEKNII